MERILTIDGGGDGFRKKIISGSQILADLGTTGPLGSVEKLLEFICADSLSGIDGISYAMAGDVARHSTIIKSPNAHFLDGVNLAEITEKETGITCVVGNDMECSTLGMAALLPGIDYFMGITWSSGIGLRFYQKGKIIADSEGGHVPLDPSPYAPLCGCGVRGCAESILGGHAIRRRVINETAALGIKIPKNIDACKFLDESYKKEKPWARDIYDLICTGMGTFLANIVTLNRVPAIVWKGSFALNAFNLAGISETIKIRMKKKLINPTWADRDHLRFILSPDPENDGLIGAAELFESLIGD